MFPESGYYFLTAKKKNKTKYTNLHWENLILPKNIVLCYLELVSSRFVVHSIILSHTEGNIILLSPSMDTALVVILLTLHSLDSSDWPGCALEPSKHHTQIGTKSHYFSAGCIMAQVGRGNIDIAPLTLSRHIKNIRNMIAALMGR